MMKVRNFNNAIMSLTMCVATIIVNISTMSCSVINDRIGCNLHTAVFFAIKVDNFYDLLSAAIPR